MNIVGKYDNDGRQSMSILKAFFWHIQKVVFVRDTALFISSPYGSGELINRAVSRTKTTFRICQNKGADQLHGNSTQLISAFVFATQIE